MTGSKTIYGNPTNLFTEDPDMYHAVMSKFLSSLEALASDGHADAFRESGDVRDDIRSRIADFL